MLRVKSNLRNILDERGISIRKLERMTKDYTMDGSGIKFETLRRLYHDTAQQYHRDTTAVICDTLDIEIGDLIILTKD